MSQLEIGAIKLTRSAVDASRIASEAIFRVEQHASEHFPGDFTFHLHLKDALASPLPAETAGLGRPACSSEVLDNLLDNAILYSPKGGKIDILVCFSHQNARMRREKPRQMEFHTKPRTASFKAAQQCGGGQISSSAITDWVSPTSTWSKFLTASIA